MRKSYVISIGLLALVAAAFAYWSGTVQDQLISQDDNMLGWYTRMAVDGNGKIHAVWNERVVNYPLQHEIHYSSSTDNGRTWSAMSGDIIISFNDGVNAENSSAIAVDSDNNLYVVWPEKNQDIKEIHYTISTDGGATWSGQTADHILSFQGDTDANNPAMVVDHNDVVHVVWNQTWQGATTEIYYSRSTDGGATWSSQTVESIVSYPDGSHASYPDIAAGPDNMLCVVFKEDPDTSATYDVINASISTDGGLTWTGTSADHPVCRAFRIADVPHVEIDPDGNIHVTWKGTQDTASPFHYEVYYSRSTDGGATWTGEVADRRISYEEPGDASISNPDMGIDHCGNPLVVWNENYIGDYDEIHISVSTDGGVTWSGENQDEIVSFPDSHPAYRPFIVAGIDDTLHVTWEEVTTTSYYQIHYSRGDALCVSAGPPIDNLTITMDGFDAILNWGEMPQAVGYKIYRSDDSEFVPSPPDSIGYTTTNSFTDPSIGADNTIKFYNVIVVY
jgi:hypothetical protein